MFAMAKLRACALLGVAFAVLAGSVIAQNDQTLLDLIKSDPDLSTFSTETTCVFALRLPVTPILVFA